MKIYWTGESKNIIGSKVRNYRKERNWTQRTLAAKLQLEGFDSTELTVLRIENGSRFVPDYEVKALCKIFGISYSDLLGSLEGSDEPL